MLICSRLGYNCTVVDDLSDDTYDNPETESVLKLFAEENVAVVQGDAFDEGQIKQYEKQYDLVTSHDSLEHWHNSPKELLHALWGQMRDGGLLWIGVPNCVNLRKRITVPFGHGKWSTMNDWYEAPVFRGHVREPDVGDLRYIANDLGAAKVQIEGKNWIGYRHPRKLVRTLIPFADKVLQLRPSLCSDINLFAWK